MKILKLSYAVFCKSYSHINVLHCITVFQATHKIYESTKGHSLNEKLHTLIDEYPVFWFYYINMFHK